MYIIHNNTIQYKFIHIDTIQYKYSYNFNKNKIILISFVINCIQLHSITNNCNKFQNNILYHSIQLLFVYSLSFSKIFSLNKLFFSSFFMSLCGI